MKEINDLLGEPKKTLLDVRTDAEFQQHHIEGSVNIPLNELHLKIEEVKAMQRPIIVYCLSGGRSAVAEAMLQKEGVDEVYNAGGISDVEHSLA